MRLGRIFWAIGLVAFSGCSRSGENSAFCGLTQLASATAVQDHMPAVYRYLRVPPVELRDTVKIRVVGYATSIAMAISSDSSVILNYEGAGYPELPGFALALVDDSSEVFRGVLVYDAEPPQNLPTIGYAMGRNGVAIPLAGLKVNWSEVNDARCPIFSDSIVMPSDMESTEP